MITHHCAIFYTVTKLMNMYTTSLVRHFRWIIECSFSSIISFRKMFFRSLTTTWLINQTVFSFSLFRNSFFSCLRVRPSVFQSFLKVNFLSILHRSSTFHIFTSKTVASWQYTQGSLPRRLWWFILLHIRVPPARLAMKFFNGKRQRLQVSSIHPRMD